MQCPVATEVEDGAVTLPTRNGANEDVAGAVVNVHLAHPGAFHHRVEGDEVFRDERDQIQRVILDGGLRLS